MAWTFVNTLQATGTKVATTVFAFNLAQTANSGDVAVVMLGADNPTGSGGITSGLSLTATAGNTWTKVLEFQNAAAALAAIVGGMWYSQLVAPITATDTLRIDASATFTAKAVMVNAFQVGAGNAVQVGSTLGVQADATQVPSIAISGLTSAERLWLATIAAEGPSGTYIEDADYTSLPKYGTTGGGAAANAAILGAYRIATLTGDTYTASLVGAADLVTILAVLEEIITGGVTYTRCATDGVFFAESRASDRSGLRPDGMYLMDAPIRGWEIPVRDSVLLGEVPGTATTRQRGVSDTLYLRDDRTQDRSHLDRDPSLLAESVRKTLEFLRRDTFLLSDAAIAERLKILTVTDAILLSDSRLSVLDKRILDGLLVTDAYFRAIEKLVLDGLLLYDTATAEKISAAGVFERTVTDTIYLLDSTLRATDALQREGLFLSDARFSDLARLLVDQVLLSDTRTTVLERVLQDTTYLSDTADRIRELLAQEGLLLYDTATAQLIQAVIAALVYALLRTEDFLGIRLGSTKFPGIKVVPRDLLGREIGYTKKQVIQ